MTPFESARLLALMYIDHAPRTSAETLWRLQRAHFDDDVARNVVADLERAGILDDRAFAAAWVESRSRARRYGTVRLESELRRKGVERDTIREALNAVEPDDESSRALALVREHFPEADLSDRRVQQRIFGFLQRRGYSRSTIVQVLGDET